MNSCGLYLIKITFSCNSAIIQIQGFFFFLVLLFSLVKNLASNFALIKYQEFSSIPYLYFLPIQSSLSFSLNSP